MADEKSKIMYDPILGQLRERDNGGDCRSGKQLIKRIKLWE